MKYKIYRAVANDPSEGWVKSATYLRTYTYAQALDILDKEECGIIYRIVPDVVPDAPAPLRNITREDFLATLVDEAKERLSFDVIHKYLPFPTSKGAGSNHNHIVNESVYPVQTEKRTVREGETLCGRRGWLSVGITRNSDCPGCLAIARGLAVRDLV